MKENEPQKYLDLSSDQLRTMADSQQLFEAWSEALQSLKSFHGGMGWKTSGGHQYLFRRTDRRGYGKSLGPRSPATEQTLEQFKLNKVNARRRENELRHRLAEQARFCRAARVARVPRFVAALARELWRSGLDKSLLIVGTNAL